ncbi:retrovirus-related pol polyprotein from transposon TNT 1-94 [Tanacetum coccineum]
MDSGETSNLCHVGYVLLILVHTISHTVSSIQSSFLQLESGTTLFSCLHIIHLLLVIRVVFNPLWLPAFPGHSVQNPLQLKHLPILLHYRTAYFLFLEFEEVQRLLLVAAKVLNGFALLLISHLRTDISFFHVAATGKNFSAAINAAMKRLSILEPWRQSHGLPPSPPSPPPTRTTPTSPISNNSLSHPSPLQNSSQNLNEIHYLSNLLDINLQQAIEATNPSTPTSLYNPPPSLDQISMIALLDIMASMQKQQSLYNGKVLLDKHDPPTVYDSEETLQLAQEWVFVSQSAKSRDESYFSNTSKMAIVSKSISIPNEEFSDDTTPSVARKFLNEEIYKILKDEISPIVNQVDARVQNFEIQFLKEATKFVRDFKSLANEADESLNKQKTLELEIDHLLRAVVTSADMQQKIERLQAQLGDLKGKSKDTSCASDTLDPLSQKLENENVELEFQVVNYLFDKASEQKDSTKGTSANTKSTNQSILGRPFLQPIKNNFVVRQPNVSQSERPKFSNNRIPQKVDKTNDLSKPVTSNSVPITKESKVVKNNNVIAPGMFRIDPRKTSREDKFVPINNVRASVRTNQITISQPHVITKKDVNSDSNGLSFTGVDNTAKTRRPQPRSNTKNDRSLLTMLRVILTTQMVIQICLWCVDSGCSKHMARNLKLLINFVWKFLGTVRFRNDHVAAILGYGDLQWDNSDHADLEVAFRRNTCFVRNLEGVDLLKGNRTTNLYTINLHEMASASPICLIACATSTKSWLWNQRLSHLNFDTIKDLAKNDLVTGLPKFRYHKEHLCPSCEQGKSKRHLTHPNLF